MKETKIWDTIANNYQHEIFSVFKYDKKGIIKKYLGKHKNKQGNAIDFGCGIGNGLPALAPLFKEILAVDISQKCIDIAKLHGFNHVHFKKVNLALKKVDTPTTDFAFCCNVAICDNNEKNYQIIRNVLNKLNKGGTAVFVLPSFESASLATWNLISWYSKEKTKIADIPKSDINPLHYQLKHISDGLFAIDNALTKHYLLGELYALFNTGNFSLQAVDKIEYDWKTEFDSPPVWMKSPFPWDWIVEVKRK